MNLTRGRHRSGRLLIALLSLVLCGAAAACTTTSVNDQNNSSCANAGGGNSGNCPHVSSPTPSGSAAAAGHQSKGPVQLLGDDAIFHDSKVNAALAAQHLVVHTRLSGSRPGCGATKKAYAVKVIGDSDFSDSSAPEVPCYKQLAQEAGMHPDVTYPYMGLLVIATYKPIVALLKQLHIAYEVRGVTVFNVATYLKVFNQKTRWYKIPGNTVYPNHNRILLWTTNPKESNLGGMLADLAFSAQNNDDQPDSINPHDPRLKVISDLYTELGGLENYSGLEVSDFFSGGMGTYPMALMYESQYLSTVVTGQASDTSLTFMYPTPDVTVQDAMVGFTPEGDTLVNAMNLPSVRKALESEGYRTEQDKSGFVNAMAAQHITVPSLDNLEQYGVQFTPLPHASVLKDLINAVASSQPSG